MKSSRLNEFQSELFKDKTLDELRGMFQAMIEKHHVHLTQHLYDSVLGRDRTHEYYVLEAIVLLKEIGLREYEKKMGDNS